MNETPNIGHGHFDATGKGHHHSGNADQHVPGDGGIPGQPFKPNGAFKPMMHNAPIHGMSVKHNVVTHTSCSSRILHDGTTVGFECQGCGSVVSGVSELVSAS